MIDINQTLAPYRRHRLRLVEQLALRFNASVCHSSRLLGRRREWKFFLKILARNLAAGVCSSSRLIAKLDRNAAPREISIAAGQLRESKSAQVPTH